MELIESYDFGRIVINGIVYTKDVIVTGEKTTAGWMRKEGHLMQIADISHALEESAPEVVIVGTGYDGMMRVPEETKLYFQTEGIELFVEKTREACDLFNVLSKNQANTSSFAPDLLITVLKEPSDGSLSQTCTAPDRDQRGTLTTKVNYVADRFG